MTFYTIARVYINNIAFILKKTFNKTKTAWVEAETREIFMNSLNRDKNN